MEEWLLHDMQNKPASSRHMGACLALGSRGSGACLAPTPMCHSKHQWRTRSSQSAEFCRIPTAHTSWRLFKRFLAPLNLLFCQLYFTQSCIFHQNKFKEIRKNYSISAKTLWAYVLNWVLFDAYLQLELKHICTKHMCTFSFHIKMCHQWGHRSSSNVEGLHLSDCAYVMALK